MADSLSPERRSWNMSRIRSKDTGPEKAVRSFLTALGFRYRLHSVGLPGKPDIVLKKWGTVVLVHGCYWHRHTCRNATTPKSNTAFWEAKFEQNKLRDRRSRRELRKLGWNVVVVWECAAGSGKLLRKALRSLISRRDGLPS